jgi:hypothetical protein
VKTQIILLLKSFLDSFRDLLPIIVVIGFFQIIVFQQPLPESVPLKELILGSLFVVMGLTFFVQGLQLGLFSIGESLAFSLAEKGSVTLLMIFSFALGFGTAIAEPALTAVAGKAASVAATGHMIDNTDDARSLYTLSLRLTVAISVGFAIVVGVLRILKGWPLHYIIIGGYMSVIVITPFAPQEIIGIAYDAGGVTTSTVTVPLIMALGVGLATVIQGRNPLTDGFGLIAFAALCPIIFVLLFGMAYA